MQSIDAYSNSDLFWLLLGYRIAVKSTAIISTFISYHAFRALREKKRIAALLRATKTSVVNAVLHTPSTETENEKEQQQPSIVLSRAGTDNYSTPSQTPREEGEGLRSSQQKHQTKNTQPQHHQQQQNDSILKEEDDINVIRKISLGLPSSNNKKHSSHAHQDDDEASGADNDNQDEVILAETSIKDFPLFTARRSLTSALDFLNPGQIVAEIIAVALECGVLLTVTRMTLGYIAPNGYYGDFGTGPLAKGGDMITNNLKSSTAASDDDMGKAFMNMSILRRWARRFTGGPPVALHKIFGELKDNESYKRDGSFSLVANSLLGAILYRDALGISAIPLLPMWFGCLVTPMCVRYSFVESDLKSDRFTWYDIRAIAAANAIRSLCHSAASIFQEILLSFMRARRLRQMEKKISALQTELHVFDSTDDYVVPSQELTGEEQRAKISLNSAKRSCLLEDLSAKNFHPENLFSGLVSDSFHTQIIASLSNAGWAFAADIIGFSSIMFLRRIFTPTAFRVQVAITIARMVCQAATLTALRFFTAKWQQRQVKIQQQKAVIIDAKKKNSSANSVAEDTTTLLQLNNKQGDKKAMLIEQPSTVPVNPLRKTVQSRVGKSAVITNPASTPPQGSSSASLLSQQQQQQSSSFLLQGNNNLPPQSPTTLIQLPPAVTATNNNNNKSGQQQQSHGNFPSTTINNNSDNLSTSPQLFPTSPSFPPASNSHLGANIITTEQQQNLNTATQHQHHPIISSGEIAQRKRYLADLDRAFGTSSALVLSHISEAVHHMLSSLSPDNNVRIHALLYLSAVDEYVSAVHHGELARNFSKISWHAASYNTTTNAPPAASSSGPSMTPRPSTPASQSISPTPFLEQNQQQQQQQSCCNVHQYSLIDQSKRRIIPFLATHTFTAEEIAERRALVAANPGSLHRPFFCAACKRTFREGFKALVLPCGHIVHAESCATRLKSDWCPRCYRPFEEPASSDRTIRQFHEAHSKLKHLAALWNKHALLPPHLWFSEWRRVRQYITHKCDEDKLKQEMMSLLWEKARLDNHPTTASNTTATSTTTGTNNNNNNTLPSDLNSTTTMTVTSSNVFLSSSATFNGTTVNSSTSGSPLNNNQHHHTSPPLLSATASNVFQVTNTNQNLNNNQHQHQQQQQYQLLWVAPSTWAQYLLESQIVFAVPDDFSPAGYGLSDVPIMAGLAALGVLAVNRQHERIVAMVHESMVDGRNGTSSSTSKSRVVVFGIAGVKC